jgi:catechol-2,3-dioxygenase
MATKIKHLAIRSGNPAQAELMTDFYCTLFDMRNGNRTDDGYVWLSLGARGIGRQAGLDHFGIEVDDIQDVMTRSKAAYPQINFLQRPSTRPFAEIGTHDPAGNVFDLYQAKPAGESRFRDELRPRHVTHFQLRAVDPAELARFYQEIYGLQLEPRSDRDSTFALTDGRVTMVIAPWSILDFEGTGVERPAIDHLGFEVESLDAFKKDLDELMESRSDLFPSQPKDFTEGARTTEIIAASCHRGEMMIHDPDGVLLDVSEAKR